MLTLSENNPNIKVNEPASSPLGFKNIPAVETPTNLSIVGTIPSWVNGVMYRSGSGKYNILLDNSDTFHIEHPFDGLAMLHRFEVNGETQTIKYNSRHTSNGVEKRIKEHDPTLLTFGPDPCKTVFGRMQSVFHHLARLQYNESLKEIDAEFEVVNVTITPNFPLGERLENELNIKRGQALVLKRDANTLQVVDTETLKPLKMFSYAHVDDQLQGTLCASHHQFDEDTNEYVNFMVKLGPVPSFQTFSLGPYLPSPKVNELPAPKLKLHEPIWRHLSSRKTMETLKPSYIHSFSMTKNYIIVPNFPFYYSFGGLSAMYYSSVYQMFQWDDTRNTLFHVVDRHTGTHVATYEADPCFAFHTANAWDKVIELPGGRKERVIYMDYCMYEDTAIVDASFEYGKMPSGNIDLGQVKPARYVFDKNGHQVSPAQFRRYRLGQVPVTDVNEPRKTNSWKDMFNFSKWTRFKKRRVASYIVLGYDLEMPRFNQKYQMRQYRYCWGICESKYAPSYASGVIVNGIIKLDLAQPYLGFNTDENSTAKIWDEPGCSCAEPIFIPNPNGIKEDDGVIMSIVNTVLEDKNESCFVLILDAATLKELARATIGAFNAITLHSSFVNKDGVGISVN